MVLNLIKALNALKNKKVFTDISLSGSEDFSFYSQNGTPGLLVLIGVRDEEKGHVCALHNNRFQQNDFENEALIYGVDFFKSLLQENNVL